MENVEIEFNDETGAETLISVRMPVPRVGEIVNVYSRPGHRELVIKSVEYAVAPTYTAPANDDDRYYVGALCKAELTTPEGD